MSEWVSEWMSASEGPGQAVQVTNGDTNIKEERYVARQPLGQPAPEPAAMASQLANHLFSQHLSQNTS